MRFIKRKIISEPGVKVNIFSLIIASGLFIGFVPVASGTFGSLFALAFLLIPGFLNYYILIPAVLLIFIIGIRVSGIMMKRYGDDPAVVIIDEITGMWIALLIVKVLFNCDPAGCIPVIVISFLFFRFFDIFKIYPADYFDKIKTGFGIMMDDVISGIYAGLLTGIVIYFIKNFFNLCL